MVDDVLGRACRERHVERIEDHPRLQVAEKAHPTIRRDHASMTTARNRKPASVGTKVCPGDLEDTGHGLDREHGLVPAQN